MKPSGRSDATWSADAVPLPRMRGCARDARLLRHTSSMDASRLRSRPAHVRCGAQLLQVDGLAAMSRGVSARAPGVCHVPGTRDDHRGRCGRPHGADQGWRCALRLVQLAVAVRTVPQPQDGDRDRAASQARSPRSLITRRVRLVGLESKTAWQTRLGANRCHVGARSGIHCPPWGIESLRPSAPGSCACQDFCACRMKQGGLPLNTPNGRTKTPSDHSQEDQGHAAEMPHQSARAAASRGSGRPA